MPQYGGCCSTPLYSSLVSCCCPKILWPKVVRGRQSLYGSQVSMTEGRWGRSSRQESGDRNWSWESWRNTVYWLTSPNMLSYHFIYVDDITHRLDPPMSTNNSENVPQTCLQSNLMETVPQQSFLILGMSWFVLSWQKVTSRMSQAFGVAVLTN